MTLHSNPRYNGDYFQDFPETGTPEEMLEWINNQKRFINYLSNRGMALKDEIKARKEFEGTHGSNVGNWSHKWKDELTLLEMIRGDKWVTAT